MGVSACVRLIPLVLVPCFMSSSPCVFSFAGGDF